MFPSRLCGGKPLVAVTRERRYGPSRLRVNDDDDDDGVDYRHRIDEYLDTLLANQPISDGEATDRCQKVTSQDGGLPELIVARSCLTNHSEAASL